jgi:hypothetical protein
MNYLKVYCNLIRKAETRTPPEGYKVVKQILKNGGVLKLDLLLILEHLQDIKNQKE